MSGKSVDEIKVGDSAEISKIVSDSDLCLYAGLSGDFHTFFNGGIVPEMLLGGYISAVIAMEFPGPESVSLSQELEFLAPAHTGDTITARVEVTEVVKEKNSVMLRTTCSNQAGDLIVDGVAQISPCMKKQVATL